MPLSERIRQREAERAATGAASRHDAAQAHGLHPDASRVLPRGAAYTPVAIGSFGSSGTSARRVRPSDLRGGGRPGDASGPGAAAHTRGLHEPFGAHDAGDPHAAADPHDDLQQLAAEHARQIAQLQAQWQTRVDLARADGIREGVRLAHEQHGQDMADAAAHAAARHRALWEAFDAALDGLRARWLDHALDVCVQTASAIACRTAERDRDLIAWVLERVFANVEHDFQRVELVVHPDDEPAARAWLAPGMQGRTLVLRTDASMHPGGCAARIDDTVIDATLAQRIRLAREAFGLAPEPAAGAAVADAAMAAEPA